MSDQQQPIVRLFSNVDYPILTANDVFKGLWRGTYEMSRNRPLKTVMAHSLSQIAGSAVGKAADSQDDRTSIAALQGNSMIVQTAVSALVAGGIDSAMGRGGKMERFIAPAVVDVAVDFATLYLYSGNPRIL
jgi:hypothetical protein